MEGAGRPEVGVPLERIRPRLLGLLLLAATTVLLMVMMMMGSPSVVTTLQSLDSEEVSDASYALRLLSDTSAFRRRLGLVGGPSFSPQQNKNEAAVSSTSIIDGRDHRALIGWGNAICSLTPDVDRFERNATSGLYDWVNASVFLDDDDISSDDNTLIDVRLCWCTGYFDRRRPPEFCAVHFDTCAVPPSSDDPVLCYATQAADTFVRSFWPVAIFWMLALSYACACSQSGRHARRYARRQLACHGRLCNPHERPTDNDSSVEADLNALLAHEPERAAFMYRRYVARQRRLRQRAQRRRQQAWYQRARRVLPAFVFGGNSGEEGSGDDPAATLENDDVLNARPGLLQHRLELKTKIFHPQHISEQEEEEDDAEAQAHVESQENQTTTSDINNDDNDGDHQRNTATVAWSTRRLMTMPSLHLPFVRNSNDNSSDVALQQASDNVTVQATEENTNTTSLDGIIIDDNDDSDDDDELESGGRGNERCAICLIRLEDGDVVGDLPCHHMMHKNCLKDWLKRKNRCPLCQLPGIARLVGDPGGGGGGGTTAGEEERDRNNEDNEPTRRGQNDTVNNDNLA